MFKCAALFVLLLLKIATAQFSPSVTVTCAVDPVYTVALTSGSPSGVIFIDGQCEAQRTNINGTYIFDASSCTAGSVPALGTEFKLVVQEYASINMGTDYVVKVTCNLDTSSVTEVVKLSDGVISDACLLSEKQQQKRGVTCSKALPTARFSHVLLGVTAMATIFLSL